MSGNHMRVMTANREQFEVSAPNFRGEFRDGESAPASPVGESPTRVAFFHQNDVYGVQGGIERYISTILESSGGQAVFVGPSSWERVIAHCDVPVDDKRGGPRWLHFLSGIVARRREINAFLKALNVEVIEFSRPEYLLPGLLFAGKRVVTIHGTGPGPGHGAHRLLHRIACWLAVLFADRVQIVGYDDSGVPALARWILGRRMAYVQAWHADSFVPTPLPAAPAEAPIRVFYAGRVAPQKDPALLFAIVREAMARRPRKYEFHYFGSDFAAFENVGLADVVINHGLLEPTALSEAIAQCHIGLLCSAFGEGSPYIVVESLACGRPFVMPALPTLSRAYRDFSGVRLVGSRQASAFVDALDTLGAEIRAGNVDAFAVAAQVASRSQSRAVPRLVENLSSLQNRGGDDRI